MDQPPQIPPAVIKISDGQDAYNNFVKILNEEMAQTPEDVKTFAAEKGYQYVIKYAYQGSEKYKNFDEIYETLDRKKPKAFILIQDDKMRMATDKEVAELDVIFFDY